MKRALAGGLVFIALIGVAGLAECSVEGEWGTDIVLDLGPTSTWPDDVTIETAIEIDYILEYWTFGSSTELENGKWMSQELTAEGPLATIDISSTISFDPQDGVLDSWQVDWDLGLSGVRFEFDATFEPGDIELDITASATAGDIALDVTVGLGDADEPGCDLGFQSFVVEVYFPLCCATVSGTLDFDCEGFNYAEFCVDEITIGSLPWLVLDACVKFEEQTKSFTISPEIDLGVVGCDFDLYYHLDPDGDIIEPGHGPLNIEGIIFDGIEIVCDVGGVQFTGITYLGDSPPGILSDTDYWEAYQISTTDDGCCGPFNFEVTVYFAKNGPRLFDVAFFDAALEIELSSSLTVDMALGLDVENTAMGECTLGFEVTF